MKKVPDWEGERIDNSWDEGETQDGKALDFLKLVLKDEIFEVYIGVGDTEVPRGIDPILWRVVFEVNERMLKRREGLDYEFPNMWGHSHWQLQRQTWVKSLDL